MSTTFEGAMPEPLITPLHLDIVLWYNSRGCDMENLRAPATMEYAEHLVRAGILERLPFGVEKRTFKLTEKGRFWLQSLLSVPFPYQRWEIQWPV